MFRLIFLQPLDHKCGQIRPVPEVAEGSADDIPHTPAILPSAGHFSLPEANGEELGARSTLSFASCQIAIHHDYRMPG
jgi:hypothetical protein